ncbi:hypothetical protein [Streptomyces sp. SPB162]|uniref:hypothetical protein n=1 Tax=Streptomyces sp. SPB162 TaxID=2940560 RepID=UPI002405C213|nr:hypothetical protein [Streptomyces sp. SPB162]MDF9817196.1 hypothetical protein [Streptomyces sp. SPB162]
MLRREGDGVRHWLDKQAMRGRDPASPHVTATWVTLGDPGTVAAQFREVVDAFEAEPLVGELAVHRGRVNVNFGWKHDGGAWTPERDERLMLRMAEPDADGASVLWRVSADEPPGGGRSASNVILLVRAVDPDNAWWEWYLHEEARPFAGMYLDAAGEAFLRILALAGRWPGTTWGAVFHDHWGQLDKVPYERYFGLDTAAPETLPVTRGYYWANLLTSGHTEEFGGVDALRSRCDAAGVRVDAVPGRPDAVVVRSTLPLTGLDDEQLVALREALAPVTPTRPYRYYSGPPLRVLKEPGTAFRRIPPEIEYPWFEDDGELTPDMGTARHLVPDEDG